MSLNRRAALRAFCSTAAYAMVLGSGVSNRSRADQPRIKPGAGIKPSAGIKPAAGIKPGASSALIIVDVQNCFVKGGTLAVAHGEDVVSVINHLAPAFQNVILTQDWHTPGHISFASSHSGKQPFDAMTLPYGNQVLWPDHCVQGTPDAALDPDLHVPQAQLVLRKGFHKDIDSYSAFMEADHRTPTGLSAYLKQRGIDTLFVCGLATDFCVAWTALDARALGFDTYVIEDACRGIDLKGSLAAAWKNMKSHGVKRIQSADVSKDSTDSSG